MYKFEDKPPEVILHKLVAGSLKSAIAAHGDISPDRIGSAVKRIVGQLVGEYPDVLEAIRQKEHDKRFARWVSYFADMTDHDIYRLERKGRLNMN